MIYPNGSKSNNNVYNATAVGIVSKIIQKEKGGYEITIVDASDGRQVVDIIPPGPELLVSEGESIQLDQPLTSNPNVGGFDALCPIISGNACILCITAAAGTELADAYSPDTVIASSPGKEVHFLKYPIYVGGNRGRGQIYLDGSKSNNNVYNAIAAGIVSKIIRKEKGGYEITIVDVSDGRQVVDIIPPGPELLVSEGEFIQLDQPLTSNPNVGGFGQGDVEIVLQDPLRVQGLLFFLASVILAQIFLVLKKKQFEKVQLSEMNF
ncbi:hypothetical protein ACB094_01G358600 [Castanea mollissima]